MKTAKFPLRPAKTGRNHVPANRREQALAKTRTSWQQGQSGNPNGRPRVDFEIRDVARQYGPDCIRILAQMAGIDGPGAANEAVRVAALRELLDRGFGKATQPVAGDDTAAPLAIDIRWAPATEPDATAGSGTEQQELEIVWSAC